MCRKKIELDYFYDTDNVQSEYVEKNLKQCKTILQDEMCKRVSMNVDNDQSDIAEESCFKKELDDYNNEQQQMIRQKSKRRRTNCLSPIFTEKYWE